MLETFFLAEAPLYLCHSNNVQRQALCGRTNLCDPSPSGPEASLKRTRSASDIHYFADIGPGFEISAAAAQIQLPMNGILIVTLK